MVSQWGVKVRIDGRVVNAATGGPVVGAEVTLSIDGTLFFQGQSIADGVFGKKSDWSSTGNKLTCVVEKSGFQSSEIEQNISGENHRIEVLLTALEVDVGVPITPDRKKVQIKPLKKQTKKSSKMVIAVGIVFLIILGATSYWYTSNKKQPGTAVREVRSESAANSESIPRPE